MLLEVKLTFTVEETAKLLGISRGTAYDLVAQGEIPSIRLGRRILVPRVQLEKLLEGEDVSREQSEVGVW